MASNVGKSVWTGRVLSGLAAAVFLASGVMKLVGGEELEKAMTHLGIPVTMVTPLAILEMACAIVYLIPATSVLGAILLAGYMGGAICSHWRDGDPFFVQIALGITVWLGVWLREPRLKAVLPVRK